MIFSGSDGSYVDERKFWGIYGMAEKLDVPVYIHPGTLLPEKVRLTAPLLIGEEDFKIGSEMEMEISTLWTEDDFDIIGYKFKAV